MLLFSVIVLAIMPFFCVWCFYAGFKLGKTERMPEVKIESPKAKAEKRKRSKEQEEQLRRTNILMKNLENYDGSSKGQQKL